VRHVTVGLALATVFAASPMGPAASATAVGAGVTPSMVDRFLSRTDTPIVSFTASRRLSASTRGGQMQAWLEAFTELDETGFHYRITGQGGSGVIRRRVLVAALDAEQKARQTGDAARASLDLANYSFTGDGEEPGGNLLRFLVKPRRKDVMLVDGAMFLTPGDADLVRVEGRLAKAPSFWTRRVQVVRRYARIADVRVPVSMESTAQVMVVGTSSFQMSYAYHTINGQTVDVLNGAVPLAASTVAPRPAP